MKLKNKISTTSVIKTGFRYLKRHKVLSTLAIYNFLLAVFVILIVSFLYFYSPKAKVFYERKLDRNVNRILKSPGNYFVSLFDNVETEQISIDISFKNFLKLEQKRNIALEKGILESSDDDYVNAKIKYKDKTLKVKLRLKGDWTEHLLGEKWSFRVIVSDENTLMGMKKFSLQHPRTRNYINEWIYHQTLKREGVLGLRYDFVDIILNGKSLGIYAIEEAWDKRLIENNNLREGVIVKFNDKGLWRGVQREREFSSKCEKNCFVSNYVDNSEINFYSLNKTLETPELKKQLYAAKNLLSRFIEGKISFSQIFDINKYAKYIAITQIFGAGHGFVWFNTRYYFNPVTSRLEPIGYDGMPGENIGFSTSIDLTNHLEELEYAKIYLSTLDRLSKKKYMDRLLEDIGEELDKKLNIIHSNYPYFIFDKTYLYYNQNIIRHTLNSTKTLDAYVTNVTSQTIFLELFNKHSLPLEILGIYDGNKPIAIPREKTYLQKKHVYRGTLTNFQILDNNILRGNEKLEVRYNIVGLDSIGHKIIQPIENIDDSFVNRNYIHKLPNIPEFQFLVVNEAHKTITFKVGDWEIKKDMIIPSGYTLIATEGVNLDLKQHAKIISYSPLRFKGNEESYVKVFSSDSTGRGIAVLNAEKESVLTYVIFENLSHPPRGDWALKSAVTFYESAVRINGVQFRNIRSETALNIVRSKFEISHSGFETTKSDAFSGNFSKGKIVNSYFKDIGNDAVVVLACEVILDLLKLENVGGKIFNERKKNKISASNIKISKFEVGVTNKDTSLL